MGDIKYTISIEGSAAFEAATKRLDDEVRKLGTGAGAAGKESKTFGQQLTDNLIPAFTAASIAADILRGGYRALKGFVESSTTGAIEEEQAERRLNTALEITGRGRTGALRSMMSFAMGLHDTTIYTHEGPHDSNRRSLN